MKFWVYVLILIIILPLQSSILRPLAIFGFLPDIILVTVYIVGLLRGPREAVFLGMALGLLQDIHSGGLLGLTGFSRGIMGLLAGLLGRHVLNVASMSNLIFITGFSLIEGILISIFIRIFYGDLSFFTFLFNKLLPSAAYTGVIGAVLIRLLYHFRIIERPMSIGLERGVIRSA